MSYFSSSPGVDFIETDLTAGLSAVSTAQGATVGQFEWGPVDVPTLVTKNEEALVSMFGKSTDDTYGYWLPLWNFLQYASSAFVVRAANIDMKNAAWNSVVGGVLVKNSTDWESEYSMGGNGVGLFAAKYPGVKGNSVLVSMADAATFSHDRTVSGKYVTGTNTIQFLGNPAPTASTVVAVGDLVYLKTVGGAYIYDPTTGSKVSLKVTATSGSTVTVDAISPFDADMTFTGITTTWEYASQFQKAPVGSMTAKNAGVSNDGLHIVIVDSDGKISGVKGKVLEAFDNLSKMPNSKKSDGTSAYYATALRGSKWIWWMDHPLSTDQTDVGIDIGTLAVSGETYKSLKKNLTKTLSGGVDGTCDVGDLMAALQKYTDAERYIVRQLFVGNVPFDVANYALSVATQRMDAVAFVSPFNVADGTLILGDTEDSVNKIRAFRNALTNTSYGVLDSGVKFQYDKHSDCYRWVALAGDTAGLTARAITTASEWASPAGKKRGSVKNVTRLGFNPDKTFRDMLFPYDINPICTDKSGGPVLMGDKTLYGMASDFDSIGIRNLFILLEQTIAEAAKSYLFEQNTETTRKLFVSEITPFLRDIQGRGGIEEFYVDVGASVNTASVIQSKTFAANIYIRPTKVIRFIKLNFIATPEGVSFSEITGQ